MPKLLTQGVSSVPKTGRILIGMVAGFKSEWWPVFGRIDGRLHVGIRNQDKPIYPIRETVSGQGLNLEVTSRVLRDGDSVSFQTDVSLNGEGAGKAKLSMPALKALEETRGAGSPDYYESYLRSVEKQGAELTSDFKEHRFSTTMSRKSLLQDALFLSEHVIKVQANDNEYCYRFQSYTPFAVDFDLDRCSQ